MNRPIRIAMALAFAAAMVAGPAGAEVKRQPKKPVVQERSFFDLGNATPPSRGSNYVQQGNSTSPGYSNFGEFYGSGTLPEGRSGR